MPPLIARPSTAAKIRQAVADLVDRLQLTADLGDCTEVLQTKIRKRPIREENDPDMFATVSGSNLSMEVFTAEDDVARALTYRIMVVVSVKNGSRRIPADFAEYAAEKIRHALEDPGALSSAVPMVSHIEIESQPWLAVQLLEQNYDVAAVAATVYTIEART